MKEEIRLKLNRTPETPFYFFDTRRPILLLILILFLIFDLFLNFSHHITLFWATVNALIIDGPINVLPRLLH